LNLSFHVDPKTVSWLQRTLDPVFGWPRIIRFSWSTAETLLKKRVLVDNWPEERLEREKMALSMKSQTKLSDIRVPKQTTPTSALRKRYKVNSGDHLTGMPDVATLERLLFPKQF
jgi:ribonuclease H2 subunit A